jgi:hypothetical protein
MSRSSTKDSYESVLASQNGIPKHLARYASLVESAPPLDR